MLRAQHPHDVPGRSLRRPVLIPAHIKGPDDMPLKTGEIVKAWVRQ